MIRKGTHKAIWIVALTSLLLSACTPPLQPDEGELATTAAAAETPAAPELPEINYTSIPADVMFYLLVAETAWQRQEYGTALRHYALAAEISQDLGVIERTTLIADYLKAYDISAYHAGLWLEQQPDSLEALIYATAGAIREGEIASASANLQRLFESNAQQQLEQPLEFYLREIGKRSDTRNFITALQPLLNADSSPELLISATSAALQVQAYDEALKLSEQLLAQTPENVEVILIKARILNAQERYQEALDWLDSSVERLPDNIELRTYYARSLAQEKNIELAKTQFEVLNEQQPEDASIKLALALINLDLQDYDSAEGILNWLVQQDAYSDTAYFYLGRLSEYRQDTAEAIRYYQNIDSGKHYLDARIDTATLLNEQGDLAAARQVLQTTKTKNTKEWQQLVLAEVSLLQNNEAISEAIDVLSQALGQQPENFELLYVRALLAEQEGNLELLENDLKAILSLDPDNSQALNALGYTLADHNQRLDEAKDYIERALSQQPDNPAFIDSMGWLQYRLGNYQEAMQLLQRALDLLNDGEIAAHLGQVLWDMGQEEKALAVWRDALNAFPEHPALQQIIERYPQQLHP